MHKLTYRASDVEVHVGDAVLVRRLLRRPLTGTVCYVPGECAPHPELEVDGLSYWAIALETKTVIAWPYMPEELAVPRRVMFVARGNPAASAIGPEEPLL